MSQSAVADLASAETPNMEPVTQQPSPLVVPIDNSSNVTMGMQTANNVDAALYTNFRTLTQFQWNTNQLPGTKVFSIAIKPGNLDEIVRYFAAAYLTWAGMVQWAINIAGTGFNGGKLLAIFHPPMVPADNINQFSGTLFSYFFIDPKMLPALVMQNRDVNRMLYHINSPEAEDGSFQNMDSISGHLTIIVYNQLVSSGPENSSLTVNVLTRLDPSFKFAQLVLPSMGLTPVTNFPDFLAGPQKDPCWGFPLTYLRVGKEVQLQNFLNWRAGLAKEFDDVFVPCGTMEFIYIGVIDVPASGKMVPVDTSFQVFRRDGDVFFVNSTNTKQVFFYTSMTAITVPKMVNVVNSVAEVDPIKMMDLYTPAIISKAGAYQTSLAINTRKFDQNFSWVDAIPWTENIPTLFNERVVSFNYSPVDTQGWPTTEALITNVLAGLAAGLSKEVTPIFTLTDTTTKAIVLYMRLNRAGFFSAVPGLTSLLIPLDTVSINYLTLGTIYEPLPVISLTAQVYLSSTTDRIKRSARRLAKNGTMEPLRRG